MKKIRVSEELISTLVGAIIVIIVGILVFTYFKRTDEKENVSERSEQFSVFEEKEQELECSCSCIRK